MLVVGLLFPTNVELPLVEDSNTHVYFVDPTLFKCYCCSKIILHTVDPGDAAAAADSLSAAHCHVVLLSSPLPGPEVIRVAAVREGAAAAATVSPSVERRGTALQSIAYYMTGQYLGPNRSIKAVDRSEGTSAVQTSTYHLSEAVRARVGYGMASNGPVRYLVPCVHDLIRLLSVVCSHLVLPPSPSGLCAHASAVSHNSTTTDTWNSASGYCCCYCCCCYCRVSTTIFRGAARKASTEQPADYFGAHGLLSG